MSKVYNESTIDAPLAEENFELAKLHLRDAEYEESEEGSKVIAALAIEESMIAKEQALAALDLKNAIEHGIKEEDTLVLNNIKEIGSPCLYFNISAALIIPSGKFPKNSPRTRRITDNIVQTVKVIFPIITRIPKTRTQ